ncbi:MAG TPA: LLM class F420-dependent oxidoreductase [Candidatus Dormibacteraeota bacterium]|nr:LLM class F420-dependent oxidoreductase [Candidatus Dormibacteraeota bacterium]
MRLGFGLPQCGPLAGGEALTAVAQRAEAIGYDSLWTIDRLLSPTQPRTKYPASADGRLPAPARRVLDPLDALTFVAASTRRIALGTSVLVLPFYDPVLLARRLTTIDVLSNGRLRLGVGTGWSVDEFEAVGVPINERGARADEALQVLKTFWTTNPVSFAGRFTRVAESMMDLRPVQQPHPPIYVAAFTPRTMRRVALASDGWMPAGVPLADMRAMFASIRRIAAEAGRDPEHLELVVRANLWISEQALDERRPIFAGSLDQIRADVAAARALGAHEILLEAGYTPQVRGLADLLEWAERLWQLAREA